MKALCIAGDAAKRMKPRTTGAHAANHDPLTCSHGISLRPRHFHRRPG
jgi:hypothetical protein